MSDATSRTGMKRATPSQDDARFSVPPASIRRVEVDGVQVFYRAAGEVNAPAVLLLHGFPTRSEEHTSELQSRLHLVCRLLLEKKKHIDSRQRMLDMKTDITARLSDGHVDVPRMKARELTAGFFSIWPDALYRRCQAFVTPPTL